MRLHFATLCAAGFALALSGCAVGPNFKAPDAATPGAWSEPAAPTGATNRTPSVVTASPFEGESWWASFKDPVLSSLIARAAQSNLDVRAAALRIAEARAQEQIAGAAHWPSLGAQASYAQQRFSEKTAQGSIFSSLGGLGGGGGLSIPSYPNPYDQYQAGFDASWELDLFGGVRRSVEAAKANTQASVEDSRDVLVSLEGEVARVYVDLRAAQLKRAVIEESLRTQKDVFTLARQRQQAGLATDLDVVNANAQVSATEAQAPALDRQIATDINQLSQLLAREPGALEQELGAAEAIPAALAEIAVGVPGDLVRRRPDIRAAEARLHAATARIGVATADLFPRISFNAAGGTQAQRFPDLADWAGRFFSIGPSIDLPIFEGGKLRANVRLEKVREKEAAVSYAKTVLGAVHDVDNALIAFNTEQVRLQSLQRAALENRDALTLARQRYQSGVSNFLDVLDAERTLQQSELSVADSKAALSTSLVAVYKALGGGWAQTAAPAG